ncbi:MAG: hypothetical protein FWF96_07350, partial [Kiritimatiellaeota bacterium]|nr:hypothetical protein [Kiritimatiellota bacterium]
MKASVAALLALLFTAAALHAQTLYWKPNAADNDAGQNVWEPGVSAWGATANAAGQVPWVDGANANFSVAGTNTVTINGPVAGALSFTDGAYTFHPGTAPLAADSIS